MDLEGEDGLSRRSEKSRPSTPKWWKPNIPPETYLWEEMRRKRQQGGYPWTLLDKDDDKDSYDHLYEPVNPPPLFGSNYMGDPETGSLDGRVLDIPPEMDIISSEGLDGLDQPDKIDLGVDGDKEWRLHPEEEKHFSSMKTVFTAGLRKKDYPKSGETSSIRPLTNLQDQEAVMGKVEQDQVVPVAEPVNVEEDEDLPFEDVEKQTPFHQLKNKAGKVKQRIKNISLPVRPFNKWGPIKLIKKKSEQSKAAGDKTESEETERKTIGDDKIDMQMIIHEETRKVEKVVEHIEPKKKEVITENKIDETNLDIDNQAREKKKKEMEDKLKEKEDKTREKDEVTKQLKEEEKLKKEAEAARKLEQAEENKKRKAEEKLQKEQAQEELKRLRLEEKLQKQKIQEELKKLKEEEKVAKAKEKEEQKKAKAEEKMFEEQFEQTNTVITEIHKEKMEIAEIPEVKEHHESHWYENAAAAPQDIEKFEEQAESPSPKKISKAALIKRKFADIDLTKKFKRSKTPPPRPEQPKVKFQKKDFSNFTPENKLAQQYKKEIEVRESEIKQDNLRPQAETQIYVTPPSVDIESETHGEWFPPGEIRPDDGQYENVPQSPSKAKLGDKIKGFGVKAAHTSKGIGKRVKYIGHDLRHFGGFVNVKYHEALKDMKTQEEARKQKEQERRKKEGREDEEPSSGRMSFRFKRKQKPIPENDEDQPIIVSTERKKPPRKIEKLYENAAEVEDVTEKDTKIKRGDVLGRADRDWESPEDRVRSRDVSEEPGNISSGWESPGPCSSAASSSLHHGRRPGVLEEIDSDEFFLRERGISEGEDDEEVNRFLVEELRQAFRPIHKNALEGFDLPSPPDKPSRLPRKISRKPKNGEDSSNFKTFPPERPKRKTPGYISSYLEGNDIEDHIAPEVEGEQVSDDEDDEGIRRVKEELRKIDQDLEDEEGYEPVNEAPEKPLRRKKKQPKKLPTPPPELLYYNTISSNEWMRTVEEQVVGMEDLPVPPKRERQRSPGMTETQSSNFENDLDDAELQFADDEEQKEINQVPLASAESEQFEDLDSLIDYMDEGGYAVVQKESNAPTTVPRRKKKSNGKGNSLKRRSLTRGTGHSGPAFCSLPRFTPRTFHIVPPTRPHRNYSTLQAHPHRPPRRKKHKTTQQRPEESQSDEGSRPSTQISIQGRPLPPPPRPSRSPLNDLDQLEKIVGVRHYANESAVVEEICTTKNIYLCGGNEAETTGTTDVNVGIQTDPLREEDFELSPSALGSFEEDDERIQRLRDSIQQSSDQEQDQSLEKVEESRIQASVPAPRTEVIFPTTLHLSELEVDFLRVNELTAHSLQTPNLHVNSLSSIGPLSVQVIRSTSLSTENIVTDNLTSGNMDFPMSIPPPSFHTYSSPQYSEQPTPPPGNAELDSHQTQVQLENVRIESARTNIPSRVLAEPFAHQASRETEGDDVVDLGRRLARAILRVGLRAIMAVMDYVEDPEDRQKQRSQLQIMFCVLLLIISGIFLMTRSTGTGEMKWDFTILPPTD